MRFAPVALVFLLGCGDGAGPAAPAPPSTSFSVRFDSAEVRLGEGETAEIGVSWEVASLAAPATLRLTAAGSASADDWTLAPETLTIPSGANLRGDLRVLLEALPDPFLTEGEETLRLSLVPESPGVSGSLPAPLGVVIEDGPYPACPGVRVGGTAPVSIEDDRFDRASLTIGVDPRAEDAALDLLGPYADAFSEPSAAFGILGWRVRRDAGSLAHEMDVFWPAEGFETGAEPLELRIVAEGCGGAVSVVCEGSGCEAKR